MIFGGLVVLQLLYVGQMEIHLSRLFPAYMVQQIIAVP